MSSMFCYFCILLLSLTRSVVFSQKMSSHSALKSSPLIGKWQLESSDNFDEYMKAVGVGMLLRKAGAAVSSTTEITMEGEDKIRINTQSTFKSANVLFTIGQEMDEKTMDGRNVKTKLTWDGNNPKVLNQFQTWDGGKRTCTQDWTHEGDSMILVLTCDGVVCERKHSRVQG